MWPQATVVVWAPRSTQGADAMGGFAMGVELAICTKMPTQNTVNDLEKHKNNETPKYCKADSSVMHGKPVTLMPGTTRKAAI